ncbi:unnamed protein product [Hapterophycus canaliculatus]
MTSCALCRREQEINPKLLRARFDEKRMLNLAQRLAIPPPARSRPPTSAAPVSSSEGIREEKEEQPRFGGISPTLAREMLVQGGDVGAMSADDLRLRWNFLGWQAPATSGATTIGAASAAELRTSWRTLEHTSRSSMYMRSGHDAYAGASNLSCSTDAEVCAIGSRSPAPNLDSPCAGGNSPGELPLRWSHLPRIPLAISTLADNISGAHQTAEPLSRCGSNHAPATAIGFSACNADVMPFEMGDVGGLGTFHLRRRWHEAVEISDVGALEPRKLSLRLTHALGGVEDIGGLDAICLLERWHEKGKVSEKMNLLEASVRATHGQRDGGTGELDASCLQECRCEAIEISDVGGMELRNFSARVAHELNVADDVGGSDAHCLRERWHGGYHVRGDGEMTNRELSIRLTHALGGGEDVGGLDTLSLGKRWDNAKEVVDVGEMEVRDLLRRLTHVLDDRSVGNMPATDLETRWSTICEEQTKYARRASASIIQRCGEALDVAGRIVADSDAASKSVSLDEQAVGAVSPGALRSRWCAAGQKPAPVG